MVNLRKELGSAASLPGHVILLDASLVKAEKLHDIPVSINVLQNAKLVALVSDTGANVLKNRSTGHIGVMPL